MAVDSISVGNPTVTRNNNTVSISFPVSTESKNGAYYHQVRVDGSVWKTSSVNGTVSGTYTTSVTDAGGGSQNYKFSLYVQWQKGGAMQEYTSTTKTASWSARTYTISYNKGDYGSGTNTTATKDHGVNLTLKDDIFTRTNYIQKGWSVNSNGSTKDYDLKGTYSNNADQTLYPYWVAVVSYKLGTYSETGSETTAEKIPGTNLTLKNRIFGRTGYTQQGWSTNADGSTKNYDLQGTYTNDAPITLYPYWVANTYTITYDKGSYGTGTNTSDTKTYGVVKKLKGAIFTRSGYKQVGWSVNSNSSTKDYDLEANYSTEENITLYPFWEVSTIVRISNGSTIKEYTKLYFSDGVRVYNIIGCYYSDGTSTHQGI